MTSVKSLFFAVVAMSAGVAQAYEVGDQVTEVVLDQIEVNDAITQGVSVTAREEGRTHTIVEFTSISCGACEVNLPILSDLAERASAGASTREIAIDRDRDAVLRHTQNNREYIKFPVALDSNRKALRGWGVNATPTIFVVDNANKVVFKKVGVLSDNDVRKILGLVKQN